VAKEMMALARLDSGMRFEVKTGSGHTIPLDMAEGGEEGENAGARPMEMLLVGLAGCGGMSILLILRKRRQDVTGYELRVHGTRAEKHPQVFEEITVEHVFTGRGLQAEVVERAIRMTEEKYCGVSVMLEKMARIQHSYRIVEI